MLLVFTVLFCVFFKSQLSCAITRESEVSFAENVDFIIYMLKKKKNQKREKSEKNMYEEINST